MFYVYGLTDPRRDNEIFYIGKGSKLRWQRHLKESWKTTGNKRKWLRIRCIRDDGFEPGVMFFGEDMTEDDALDLETFAICYFGRKKIDEGGILTNFMTEGSPKGCRKRVPMSAEARAKIGANSRRCLTGRKQSPEMIENRRKALIGRTGWTPTSEQRLAHSRRMKGRSNGPRSEAQKRAISQANSGAGNGMFGRTHSKEAKATIATNNRLQKMAWIELFVVVVKETIETHKITTQKALMDKFNEIGVTTRQGRVWKAESISYALRQCGIKFGNLAA